MFTYLSNNRRRRKLASYKRLVSSNICGSYYKNFPHVINEDVLVTMTADTYNVNLSPGAAKYVVAPTISLHNTKVPSLVSQIEILLVLGLFAYKSSWIKDSFTKNYIG